MTGLGSTSKRLVHRMGERPERTEDVLTVEEPMEIELVHFDGAEWQETTLSITMRTPGHDFELAAGFLFTEGILGRREEIESIQHCPLHGEEQEYNVVQLRLAEPVRFDEERLHRHFYTTSSCGICGKTSLDAVRATFPALPKENGASLAVGTLRSLPERLRASQEVFDRTGGLHAAAIFGTDGAGIVTREDIGRHNALDKAVGERFLAGEVPLWDAVVMVSGRASFELVQKALAAGIPILAAVGAASTLAVDLASEYGMTLVGFLRDGHFTVYCGAERLVA